MEARPRGPRRVRARVRPALLALGLDAEDGSYGGHFNYAIIMPTHREAGRLNGAGRHVRAGVLLVDDGELPLPKLPVPIVGEPNESARGKFQPQWKADIGLGSAAGVGDYRWIHIDQLLRHPNTMQQRIAPLNCL